MPAIICTGCDKNIPKEELMQCSKCQSHYHFSCAGFTSENFKKISSSNKESWKCCKVKKSNELSDLMKSLRDDLTTMQQESSDRIFKKMEEQTKMMASLLKENEEIKNTIQFLTEKYEVLLKKLNGQDEMEKEIMSLKQSNKVMEKRVEYLEERVDSEYQLKNTKKLEIRGIPHVRGEKLEDFIMKIRNTVNVEVRREDIERVKRFSYMSKDKYSSNVEPPSIDVGRQGNITATFTSVVMRDKLLNGIKVHNRSKDKIYKLNTANIGMEVNIPIYVQEALTPRNRHIYLAARRLAKEKSYKYVWIKEGKILMRKEDSGRVIRIKTQCFVKCKDLSRGWCVCVCFFQLSI
jgi:hypothetical protein